MAWLGEVRRCQNAANLDHGNNFVNAKAIALDILSNGFRRLANRHGVRVNPAFAGTYGFATDADYAQIFPKFLRGLPDGSVVMCHPGFVDAELQRLDPLTTSRIPLSDRQLVSQPARRPWPHAVTPAVDKLLISNRWER